MKECLLYPLGVSWNGDGFSWFLELGSAATRSLQPPTRTGLPGAWVLRELNWWRRREYRAVKLSDSVRRFISNYTGRINDKVTMITFKGTVSVISSDPPCKNFQFTRVPLKPESDQKSGRKCNFSDSKSVYFFKFLFYFI